MIKYLFITSLTLVTMSGFVLSQSAPIKFSDRVQKFGKVDEGVDVTLKYTFMNEGKQPILINDAKVNCSCTVVDFPKTPIGPAKFGQIVVTFHTEAKIGYQERKIDLSTNLGSSQIVFKGVVIAKEETVDKYKATH
ncbi:MAG: DUF1573 domain-containing protein [Vicingaceae bacterium]